MKTPSGYQRLDNAIDGLTHVFKRYGGSPHWSDPLDARDSSATVTHSVWELTDDEYRDFCWHAVSLGGPAESQQLAIRYFLPRVAQDIALDQRAPWCDGHLAFLLNTFDWRSWPQPEREAIETWFGTWIEHRTLSGDWRRSSATSTAGICGFDFQKFFHTLRERERGLSIQWLAQSIEDHWESLLQTGWPERWHGYWGTHTAQPRFAVKFIVLLLRKSSRRILESAFFHEVDLAAQSCLSAANQHADQCVQFGRVQKNTPLATALACEDIEK